MLQLSEQKIRRGRLRERRLLEVEQALALKKERGDGSLKRMQTDFSSGSVGFPVHLSSLPSALASRVCDHKPDPPPRLASPMSRRCQHMRGPRIGSTFDACLAGSSHLGGRLCARA